MTVAKSIGGGLFPNAAVLYRAIPRLVDYVESNPGFHPSTTGGSDLGSIVSLAVLEFIEKNRLWENSARMGERLKEALLELKRDNPKIIKDVRGRGLMIGIEYLHEFMGPMMADSLAKNGIFAAYSGNAPQVMRFMFSLTVTEQEMEQAIRSIREAVRSMKTILPLALPAARVPAILNLLNNEKVQTSLFGFLRAVEEIVGGAVGSMKGGRR
jgi:putrescine aminotransferase